MKINIFYFSGTGNTLYYVDHIIAHAKNRAEVRKFDISKNEEDFLQPIISADVVVLAYPTIAGIYSFIIRDFVEKYNNCFLDKEVALISVENKSTGGSLSTLKRKMDKMGAVVRWARCLHKPNNVTDLPILRNHPTEENEKTLLAEIPKLNTLINDIFSLQDSIVIPPRKRVLGAMERVIILPRIQKFRQGLKINLAECNYCLKCVEMCPSGNIFEWNRRVCAGDKCVACYRCVNGCPRKAISLLSKYKPRKQYKRIPYNKGEEES